MKKYHQQLVYTSNTVIQNNEFLLDQLKSSQCTIIVPDEQLIIQKNTIENVTKTIELLLGNRMINVS